MVRPLAVLVCAAACLAAGCVGHERLTRVQRLSDDEKALFSKYKQFMTEGQQDEFLAQTTPTAREDYVRGLHVEERLERYPKYVRDSIWQQEVVAGMDAQAVLLTWGLPTLREWDDAQRAKGNDVERWSYRRDDRFVQVVMSNGVVTQVVTAEGQH